MKSYTYSLLMALFLVFTTAPVLAQKTVERHENGNKKYQGRVKNGIKVGKHQFWYESGKKQREEKYDDRGILILIKEWNEEGKLTKEENPEEGFEKIRRDVYKRQDNVFDMF